jgi:hypothetical protein
VKLLAAALVFACLPSIACEIPAAEVSYKKGSYEVAVEMLQQAPPAAVTAVLLDHENLHRISESFTESVVLSTDDNGRSRRRLHIKTCIALFCFDMDMVEDVEINSEGTILTTIIPELSGFDSGHARWQIAANDSGSRLHFSSKRDPSFWIPPIVGPWILKRKVISETTASCHMIETIALESNAESMPAELMTTEQN